MRIHFRTLTGYGCHLQWGPAAGGDAFCSQIDQPGVIGKPIHGVGSKIHMVAGHLPRRLAFTVYHKIPISNDDHFSAATPQAADGHSQRLRSFSKV